MAKPMDSGTPTAPLSPVPARAPIDPIFGNKLLPEFTNRNASAFGWVTATETAAWMQTHGVTIDPRFASNIDVQRQLGNAAAFGWTFQQFDQALDTTQTGRTYGSLIGNPNAQPSGPGSGRRAATTGEEIAAAAAAIRDESDTIGLSLTDQQINGIATSAVKNNWGSAQLTNYLTQGMDYTKMRAGTFTAGVDSIKKLASEQLLNISDASAQEYSRRLISGEIDQQGLTSLFTEQAKKNYAWAQPQLDKGITMRSFLLPSRDFIAQELEKPSEAIDMRDPTWLSMMQTIDAKTGQSRAASLSEMQANARKHPDFAKTNKAQSMMLSAADAIRTFMGA